MRKVERSEILDYVTYTENRSELRSQVLQEKDKRRIHLGSELTFLFENTLTAKYQIQEMMRVERLVKEEAILHEMQTYNDLLGDENELGCTLLIEIEDPSVRDVRLKELVSLPQHIYLKLENGQKAFCSYDKEQVGEHKVSSVQFLKFKCDVKPIAIGCDHPQLCIEQELTPEQKETLSLDLSDS